MTKGLQHAEAYLFRADAVRAAEAGKAGETVASALIRDALVEILPGLAQRDLGGPEQRLQARDLDGAKQVGAQVAPGVIRQAEARRVQSSKLLPQGANIG